MIAGIQY